MIMKQLAVNEYYGPVFQGEGPSLGTPCMFLRTVNCGLHCSWCDTPFSWRFNDHWPHDSGIVYDRKAETHMWEPEAMGQQLLEQMGQSIPLLVISGGEPMLQQEALGPVLAMMQKAGKRVEFETAGVIAPLESTLQSNVRFNVSPKLENSGNSKKLRYRPDALNALMSSRQVQAWKFVVVEMSDLDEIDEIVNEHLLAPVYVMPEGVSADAVNAHAQAVAQAVIARGWYLTTRLHVLLYGNARGV